MDEALVLWWDGFERAADEEDAFCSDARRPSWVPPNMGALARAVRRTSLCRLFPFTSHALLCLSDREDFWQAGLLGGQIAPAFVARTCEDGYLVHSGSAAEPHEASRVLVTHDAVVAAAQLELLLAAWPPGRTGDLASSG
ncbi:hypothetical protein [Actinomadura rupiterrae]|uniref:hypothetical protein n=1 Tax=Actinomadura rupiterrae TaxID=559627 RepID=UPI0020A36AE3|nr:hypothetical protein [Actinomadura rupiterrae]MCP2338976.1 hypothetical protein [Actinomadura rupiterrae]